MRNNCVLWLGLFFLFLIAHTSVFCRMCFCTFSIFCMCFRVTDWWKKKKTMRRDSVICTAFTFSAAILLLSSFSRSAVANIWTILGNKQVWNQGWNEQLHYWGIQNSSPTLYGNVPMFYLQFSEAGRRENILSGSGISKLHKKLPSEVFLIRYVCCSLWWIRD